MQRITGGTRHKSPGRATVGRDPGAELAAAGAGAATRGASAVAIRSDRLSLSIDHVGITGRDRYVNTSELIAGSGIDIGSAAAGINVRVRRVGGRGPVYEAIRVTGDRSERR